MRASTTVLTATLALGLVGAGSLTAQRGGAYRASRDHPAIEYTNGPADNVITRLNQRLRDGSVSLVPDGTRGYLPAVLEALDIPVESQVSVFSKTSFQADFITPDNPRAIYFADDVAVAWVRGRPVLEAAAHDPRQGAIFYTLDQSSPNEPRFERNDGCLACHLSWDTLGVPGFQVLSTFPMSADPNAYATGFASDHRSRIQDRWGGWYVTGRHADFPHIGNVPVNDVADPDATIGQLRPALTSLQDRFDLDGYLSPYSDVAALMVLEHQTHMANLITRIGWEARRIGYRHETTLAAGGTIGEDDPGTALLQEAAVELVDYLLFVDEAPLPVPLESISGFADRFAARGPRDDQDRSLRDFDLRTRLFRFPCSYMIYSDAFDAVPAMAKEAIYARLWAVLSGQVEGRVYERLPVADRQAIVEILRATKPDLPAYFQPLSSSG